LHEIQEGNGKPTFEERLAKVNLMIERAELDDDKLEGHEQALSTFSDEAVELKGIVKKIGPQRDVCNKKYLTRYFETFYMKRGGIECLDQHIENFTNLQILNLSFNKLETIEYLPPNLKELHVASNQLVAVRPSGVIKSLIHLGLSNNLITEA
jgi:Leucine-rich repeat (LRR) protein